MSCPLIANLDTIRVTKVNACGVPVSGATSGFVTECIASLEMAANIDEGDDVVFKAANGKLCGFRKACPSLLNLDITLTIFQASPELFDILTGNPVVDDFGGDPIGTDTCAISCDTGFALEAWAEVLDSNCTDGGTPKWIYVLIPWVTNGQIGDLTLSNEAVNFEITGSSRAGGGWDQGPYNVMSIDAMGTPGPMLTPVGPTCHRRIMEVTVAPPAPSCDYVPVPVPAP